MFRLVPVESGGLGCLMVPILFCLFIVYPILLPLPVLFIGGAILAFSERCRSHIDRGRCSRVYKCYRGGVCTKNVDAYQSLGLCCIFLSFAYAFFCFFYLARRI
jgi:hypothetical protein